MTTVMETKLIFETDPFEDKIKTEDNISVLLNNEDNKDDNINKNKNSEDIKKNNKTKNVMNHPEEQGYQYKHFF